MERGIIPKDKDTTYYLWEILFRCKVPQLATTSETYYRIFGSPTTGDAAIDRELQNQWIDTMIPIVKMVEYFNQGITIRVVNYADTKIIYDYIQRHLELWLDNVQHGLNIGNAPVEDLIAMDKFASTVFNHAKHQYEKVDVKSSFMRALDGLGFRSPDQILPPKHLPAYTPTQQEEIRRESLANAFKDTRLGGPRWR